MKKRLSLGLMCMFASVSMYSQTTVPPEQEGAEQKVSADDIEDVEIGANGELIFKVKGGKVFTISPDNLNLPEPVNDTYTPPWDTIPDDVVIVDSVRVFPICHATLNTDDKDTVTKILSVNGSDVTWDLSDIIFNDYERTEIGESCEPLFEPSVFLTSEETYAFNDSIIDSISVDQYVSFHKNGCYIAKYNGTGTLITPTDTYENVRKISVNEYYITTYDHVPALCTENDSYFVYFFAEYNDTLPILMYSTKTRQNCIRSFGDYHNELCSPQELATKKAQIQNAINYDSIINLRVTPIPVTSFSNGSISYYLPEDGTVKITIVNILGTISQPVEETSKVTGNYTVPFNTVGLISGLYHVTLEYNGMVFKELFTKF